MEVVGRFLASEVGQVCRRQFLAEEQVCSQRIDTAVVVVVAVAENRCHQWEVCCTLNLEMIRIRSFRNWKAGWRTTAVRIVPCGIQDPETWPGFGGFRGSGRQDHGIRWFRRVISVDSKIVRIRSFR